MQTTRRTETFAAVVASIALAAGSLFAVSAAQAADVTIVSTDFEDGTLGAWVASGPPDALSVIDFEGGKVLQVADRDQDYVGPQTAPGALASLEVGTTYTFSMRARLADGTPDTQLRFVMKPPYTWIGNTTVTAGAWTTVTGTYTVPAGTDPAELQVYVGSQSFDPAVPYTYYVDDLVITGPSSGPVVTTVTEVDFEDGTTGTWTPSGNDGTPLTVVDDAGDKVLQVADRGSDFFGIQSPTGIFQPGTEYTFSMRVKLAPGTPDSGVRFVMKPGYDWIGNTTATDDDWTVVTGVYTTAVDADPAELQVYIGTADLTSGDPYTYFVDDILVTTQDDTGTGPDPDVIPGGAVNPTTTPTTLAQGTGNVAALTFDDGPSAYTPELLDFLAEKDIKAVFCVIGQNIQDPGGAELLRRIVAEGHVLCNHTTSYADMGSWSTAAIRDDLVENLRIIREALGDPNAKVPFFRAPNGSWGATPGVAVSLGMQPLAVINTINDWDTQDQAILEANLRAAIKPGQIALVHDGGGDRSGSIAAVKTVVQERLDDGWTFTLPVGTPPPDGQVALSTDFEEGLDGWEPRAAEGGPPVVEIVTDPVHGGAQAAMVTQRPDEGAGIRHEVTGILQPGVTYELTAWLRFADDGPVGDIWLSAEGNNPGEPASFSTLGQFTDMSRTEWVQVTQRFTLGEFERTWIYFETAYQVPNQTTFYIDDIVVSTPAPAVIQDLVPIHETVDFPVGVAVDSRETLGAPAQLTLKHFTQLTAENHMKPEAWYDAERNFRINPEAKALMDFAQENGLRMYGHVLVWHSQTPDFLFQTDGGTPLTSNPADQEILRERLRTHIFAIAQNLHDTYGDFGSETNPLVAWDVVNEVVSDSGDNPDGLRRSEWFRILGEEFIDLAFHYADEAFNELYAAPGTDRPVKLFINDYNTEQSGKQQRYRALVDRLISRGVPIDGVGHQFHVSLAMPVTALQDALEAFEDTGLLQAVTEFDVTTGTPVTQAKLVDQGYYYRDAFRIFRDFQQRTGEMFSVTVWGLNDGRSWRNSNGAPLVFDDGMQAKPAYYGIVDSALPAPLRTANVFRADIPATADGAAAAEWKRLPLIAISADARFQARWSPDRLTVLVEVDDLTTGGDEVEVQLGGDTVTLGRNGTGTATGAVVETATGYRAIVELPLSGAAQDDTLALDVRVTDGLSTVAWNAPGETGTLTLLEAVSFVEVVQAASAPVIDGVIDDVWADANVVTTAKHVEGSGAEATVRTLWRGGTLYVLAEVADPVVDVSGSDPWIQDSVELYVDPGNVKNGSYRYDDSQIRISATNVLSFGTGDEAFQRARVQSQTATVDGGYLVEVAIALGDANVLGGFHGLDFQVNDAQGGARIGIANWADPSGVGYQSTARWGVGELVGPAEPGDDEPTVKIGNPTVQAGGKVDIELSGFEPGATVEIQLDRPASASGAGGGTGGFAATARGASAAALPATLGTFLIGPDGTASGSVTIPSDTTPGSYRLAAYVGGSLLASGQLTVLAAAVAATGADASGALGAALLMLLAGGVLALRARRRGEALRLP